MREQINARRRNRVERVPLHAQRDNMNVRDRDPNYSYRWVNDVDNGQRIQKFKTAGYEMVQEAAKVGDAVVEDNTNKTSTVTEKFVGRNTKAFLMRIQKDWYDEDQKAKARRVDQSEAGMREDALANYGEIKRPKFNYNVKSTG